MNVKMSKLTEYEITIKFADRQLELLENKAKALGLSKEELIKIYVVEGIGKDRRVSHEQRLAKIISIKGKYSSVLTSSDEFARSKKEEIQMER